MKVLIITYYWPPAGGRGVQRVLKFVKYLPEFGIQPVVLTVEDGDYPAMDESLAKEVPDSVYNYSPHPIYNIFGEPLDKSDVDSGANLPGIPVETCHPFRIKVDHFLELFWNGWKLFTGIKNLHEDTVHIFLTIGPYSSLQITNRRRIKWLTGEYEWKR